MFERFTDRARRVVVLAQEEARLLDHSYIGTEHILLGVAREGEGIGATTLISLGLSLEDLRADVLEIVGRGPESPSGHIPFTPRAKKVLELSLRQALALGHDAIGTEHILLGIAREGQGVAAQVLVRRGAELSRVRARVLELLGDRGAGHRRTVGLRPATCDFCGTASPACGSLFVGTFRPGPDQVPVLVCERCVERAASGESGDPLVS
jgi:ATP-dependent Clp protease ATP-binding subunit ClpC